MVEDADDVDDDAKSEAWLELRKNALLNLFSDAYHKEFGYGGNETEFYARWNETVDQQARAERMAYLRGESIPDYRIALESFLQWRRSGDCKNGTSDLLPKQPWREFSPGRLYEDEPHTPAHLAVMEPRPGRVAIA